MNDQELQQILNVIAQKLSNKKQDGIITYRRARTVYVAHGEDSYLLYFWNREQGKEDPVEGNAIRGKLCSVNVFTKNEGDKFEAQKLHLLFLCSEENYRLEVGLQTVTAKSILLDIIQMDHEQLKKPVTVAFKRAESATFGKVIEAPYVDRTGSDYSEIDSLDLVTTAQALLGQQANQF